jgi:hypothetical protein
MIARGARGAEDSTAMTGVRARTSGDPDRIFGEAGVTLRRESDARRPAVKALADRPGGIAVPVDRKIAGRDRSAVNFRGEETTADLREAVRHSAAETAAISKAGPTTGTCHRPSRAGMWR